MSNEAQALGPVADSLILGSGRQLRLLDEEADSDTPARLFESAEQRGTFTGERLFLRNPRLYRAVVKLLGRGESLHAISELLEVSINTIRGVARREGVPIDTERIRAGAVALDVARLSFETLAERLADPEERAKLSAKDLAVVAGIATQNSQLLLGQATSRIESIDGAAAQHGDWLEFLRGLRTRNVTGTGLGAETLGTKEGSALPIGADQAREIEVQAPPSTTTPPSTENPA